MASKYQVTNLNQFNIDTESQTYNVKVEVDSLDYITLKFGESFSLRLNYNDAEKIEHVIRDAKYIIQDQNIDRAGQNVANNQSNPRDWNPSDPTNW